MTSHLESIVLVGDIHTNGHRRREPGTMILVMLLVVLAGSAAELINYGFLGQRIRVLDARSDDGVPGLLRLGFRNRFQAP